MSFFKYGLALLAGTGFGTAMGTLRNSRCPLHKHDSCSCHRRRHCPVDGAGRSPDKTGLAREYYDAQDQEKGKRCPKKGGKENKGDHQTSYHKSEQSH